MLVPQACHQESRGALRPHRLWLPAGGSPQERLSDTQAPRPRTSHAWGCPLDVVYTGVCGLDIHKQRVVACQMTSEEGQPPDKTIWTFGTITADLLALADWRHTAGCPHVAVDRTGVYWRPIDNWEAFVPSW
jgi:hypothetical protein